MHFKKNLSLPEREGQHEYLKRKLLLETRRQKRGHGWSKCLYLMRQRTSIELHSSHPKAVFGTFIRPDRINSMSGH